MVYRLALAAAGLLSANIVSAQTGTGTKCGENNLCPSSLPCCSQYGECGVGAYCLGGCDPLFSHTLDSCVPAPVCETKDYQLNSLDGIQPNTKYLGDASKADWVSSGTPLEAPTNDAVILTLSEDGASSSGTLLASTHYVWYGRISATMKSSRGQGVVSAFILLADNKDEIDFEFVGTDLNSAQSNYYWQGVTNYNNEKNVSVDSGGDTFSAYHNYTIDWQPNQLTWYVDGTSVRTLQKSATFNKTDNQYHYPQTPARVQLSLWPAGISSNGQGTVDWSGGLINWKAQDVSQNGYYYSMFKDVNVECYPTPSGANISGGNTSYIYTDRKGINTSIALSDNPGILKSLLGSGTDLGKDYPSHSSGSPSAAATSGVAVIPGLTGAGPGTDGSRGGGGSGSNGGGSGSGSGGGGAAGTSGAAGAAATDFSQGTTPNSKKSEAGRGETLLIGSMVSALAGCAGLLFFL